MIARDEFPRADSSLSALGKLRPCFAQPDGSTGLSVTAGNSSGVNDGAALVMMMSASEARERGLSALVRVRSWSQHGGEPMLMGVAPIEAVRAAVLKAGWTLDDVDLFELNEAFAAQSVAIVRELKLDQTKVNVNGGSIAIGQ